MSDILKNPFRVILLAATISTLFAFSVLSDLSADNKALRKQVEAGDPKAPFNIDSMYENGSGVRQDHPEAAKWYWKASIRTCRYLNIPIERYKNIMKN